MWFQLVGEEKSYQFSHFHHQGYIGPYYILVPTIENPGWPLKTHIYLKIDNFY